MTTLQYRRPGQVRWPPGVPRAQYDLHFLMISASSLEQGTARGCPPMMKPRDVLEMLSSPISAVEPAKLASINAVVGPCTVSNNKQSRQQSKERAPRDQTQSSVAYLASNA